MTIITADVSAGRSARRNTGRRSPRAAILAILAIALVLAMWQILSATGVFDEKQLPSAAHVISALFGALKTGAFWQALWNTLASALAGLAILTVLASVIALVVTSSRFVYESTWFLFEFLGPIPPIALIPLGLLLWGPSSTMKITLVVFGAIWPLLTQLIYASRAIDHLTLDVARSYRFGPVRTARYVILPAVAPYALTGLRVSASIAIVISVVTEMVGGAAGLGQQIVIAQSAGNLPEMYALIVAAGLLGLVVNGGFSVIERGVLFWHPSQRKESP